MSPKHSQTLSIAAAGLAALAVAGCGGDDKQDAAKAPTPTAAAQTPAATTPAPTTKSPAIVPAGASDPVKLAAVATDRQDGALAVAMKGSITAQGDPVPVSGKGTVDRKRQRGAFTIKTSFGAKPFTIDEITDKQMLYLRSKLFAGKLPGGRSWMRIDLAEAARSEGVNLDALGTTGPSQDPTQALDYLKGAGAAKELGTAKVNGVATTHYRVQVDLKRAVSNNAKASAKRSIDRLITTLGGPTTIPVDVWVDADHLVRRQHVAYTATVGGEASKFTFTTDYTGFDAKVEADPPALGDTIDGLEVLKQAAKAQQQAQG